VALYEPGAVEQAGITEIREFENSHFQAPYALGLRVRATPRPTRRAMICAAIAINRLKRRPIDYTTTA
jgi:hypothetical protein